MVVITGPDGQVFRLTDKVVHLNIEYSDVNQLIMSL